MEPKKTQRADLENKRGLFLQIGMIVSLMVVFMAFEWRFYEKEVTQFERIVQDIFEEDVQVTKQEEPPPPKETPPETDVLQIVEDDVELEEEFTIDAEANQETEVKFVPVEIADEEEVAEAEIFTIVEEQPGFPGGDVARIKYIQENVKYPQIARESGIQGTVYVTFVVEPDGSVTNVRILRGIGGGCDEEAMRVVKNMPKWKPGKQRGKSVRVQFNMPIKFTLAG